MAEYFRKAVVVGVDITSIEVAEARVNCLLNFDAAVRRKWVRVAGCPLHEGSHSEA